MEDNVWKRNLKNNFGGEVGAAGSEAVNECECKKLEIKLK